MSEEGDIDVESAEDVPDIAVEATATTVEDRSEVYSPTGGHMDKRAHHNALERRRRDHIKDSFHGLRDSIPSLHGEKISRAHILNKATDYIRVMHKSGLSREQEIQQLKRRNEILEEQVRALEAARALGSTETAEDILQSVAEKVESRQQQQSKANSTSATTTSGKSERNNSADKSSGGKTSQQSSGGSSKQPTPVVVKGGEASNSLTTNHMSILAKNQSLLSALQKNLSSPNLPASIKSLAARVLASPLGRTQAVNSGGNIPRGIVTATTVPKGSSFTSSPLPNTLQQQLQPQQQAKTNQTHTKSSLTDTPPKVPTAANTTPSTNEHASPVITNCSKPPNTHNTATVSSPDKTAVESSSPSPLTQTTNSDGSKAATAVASSAPSSSSSTLTTSANATPVTASSLASQLLDAHSLLQQQGAGTTNSSPAAVVNSTTTIPLISPELLAQVSSFLNVPGQNTSLPDASESVARVSASESSDQDSLSVDASLQGIKRPSSSQELDSEHSVKKIHLEA